MTPREFQTEFDTAVELGRTLIAKRQAEAEAANEARKYAERCERLEEWQPYIAAITSAMPQWAHSYVHCDGDYEVRYYSGNSYDAQYRPLTLKCGVQIPAIFAFTDTTNVAFESGTWDLAPDEDTGQWRIVCRHRVWKMTKYEISSHGDTFEMALANAVDEAARYSDLAAEMFRRNADRQRRNELIEAAAIEEACVPPAPVDPLERIADALERLTASYENSRPF